MRAKLGAIIRRNSGLGPDAPKVNGEVEDEDMEEDNLSEEESIECPKPPVNEQVKKGRLLLKQYLSEVGCTEQLLGARTARLQMIQSLANCDMVPPFHKPIQVDQSTSPSPNDVNRFKNHTGTDAMSPRENVNQHQPPPQDDMMIYMQRGNIVTMGDEDEDSSDEEKDFDEQTANALDSFNFIETENDDEEEEDEEEDMEGDDDEEDGFGNHIGDRDGSLVRNNTIKGVHWNNYDSLDLYSRDRPGKRFNRKIPSGKLNFEEEEIPIPGKLPKGTDNIPSGMKVSIKNNNDFKDIDFIEPKDERKRDVIDDGAFSLTSLGELAGIQVSNDVEPSYDSYALNSSSKFWQLRCSLRAHFDSVRQLCFHPQQPYLFTASEDQTLRMWDVEKMNSIKKGAVTDIDPCYTFRGHKAPVLCCACSSDGTVLFSGGADATVRWWRIPDGHNDLFDYYDRSIEDGELRGHEEAVWGVACHPQTIQTVSCSADGQTCVWDINQEQAMQASFASPDGSACTCVDYVRNNSDMVAVGYASSDIVVFNIPSKSLVVTLSCEPGATESVNSITTHPTTSTLIGGYNDKQIRIFDISSGEMVHCMVTHLEPVTAVAIDPSGIYLSTVGHDCSLRIWGVESRACTQEMTAHQKKYDEAILSVQFHPTQPYIATAGADSTIKLYQ